MSNLLLFIIGLTVTFVFLGGMLIHTLVSQKIANAPIQDTGRKAKSPANMVTGASPVDASKAVDPS
jgi:hypothetical protein